MDAAQERRERKLRRAARRNAKLHKAARRGDADAVQQLLEDGADPRAADADGMTALHHACRGICAKQPREEDGEYWDEETFAALFAAGADVNAVDKAGRRPLHCVQGCEKWDDFCEECGYASPSDAAHEVVEALTRCGADLDATTADGETALSLALKRGDGALAAALVQHGAALALKLCPGCERDAAHRTGLQSLLVGVAAEAGRLQREREAWAEERAAWARERAALEAAGGRAGVEPGAKPTAAAAESGGGQK